MFKNAALHSQYIYFKSSKKEMQKHGEPASEEKKKLNVKKYLTMCFYLPFQACKMSCQSSCVGVLWRQPSAMWHATRRASCSAATMTAGAGARPASQNAIVPLLTSRSWRTTWRRANRPGATTTKSSWNQVGTVTLNVLFCRQTLVKIDIDDDALKEGHQSSKHLERWWEKMRPE